MSLGQFDQSQEANLVFHRRMFLLFLVVVIFFVVLVGRLIWLQGIQHSFYQALSEGNHIAFVPIVPHRGLIYDCHGIVLAKNDQTYSLEIKKDKKKIVRATIERLSMLVPITERDHARLWSLYDDNASTWLPIRHRLTPQEMAVLASQLFRLSDVRIEPREYRYYPYGSLAAHVLGYMGRIQKEDLQQFNESNRLSNYLGSDMMGRSGVEMTYESDLHGKTGFEQQMVNASGQMMPVLHRDEAVSGHDIHLTIDARLQHYAESLFAGKRGALVALDPETGAVLAFVSAPAFDPNLFADGIDVKQWTALNADPKRPLVNRPMNGLYPPGSTYKPFLGMAALHMGIRHRNDAIHDMGYFLFHGRRYRDDREGGHGIVNMEKAIIVSCDTYFYSLVNDMGVDVIHDQLSQFGFGELTGIDLPNETRGILPSTAWKAQRYHQVWYPGETISLGVGQGYNAFTPLQIAASLSGLAHDGHEMSPHVLDYWQSPDERKAYQPHVLRRFPISRAILRFMTEAMHQVTVQGTARWPFYGVRYAVAGKTGTAQVVGIKQNEHYDAKKTALLHRDHSWFEAFAPLPHPRIAVIALVENGGWGNHAAAPIVRRLLDYYLLGLPGETVTQDHPDLDAVDRRILHQLAQQQHRPTTVGDTYHHG